MAFARVMSVVRSRTRACCRMAMGGRVRPGVVRCESVSRMAVSVVTVTGVTMRITMTVSMATQTTNRHPREANSAKRESGEIYVH